MLNNGAKEMADSTSNPSPSPCFSTAQILSYYSRVLDDQGRKLVEKHVIGCIDCSRVFGRIGEFIDNGWLSDQVVDDFIHIFGNALWDTERDVIRKELLSEVIKGDLYDKLFDELYTALKAKEIEVLNNSQAPTLELPPLIVPKSPIRARARYYSITAAIIITISLLTPLLWPQDRFTEAEFIKLENLIRSRPIQEDAHAELIAAIAKYKDDRSVAMLTTLQAIEVNMGGYYEEAIQLYYRSLELAEKEGMTDFIYRPAAFLHINLYSIGKDSEAIAIGEMALARYYSSNSKYKNIRTELQLRQLIALCRFNLDRSYPIERELRDTIRLAGTVDQLPYIVQGYNYIGIAATHKGDYSSADIAFTVALDYAKYSNDEPKKNYFLAVVKPYQARLRLLEKNYTAAIESYEESIIALEKAGINKSVLNAQVYNGLMDSYLAIGETDRASALAGLYNRHLREAEQKCQKINRLMIASANYIDITCKLR